MYISLISPLRINECISRLENARKKEVLTFSREFTPPKCDVKGNIFTLRKNYLHFVPHRRGELAQHSEGTTITYIMKIDATTRQLNSIWLAIALPLTFCFVAATILDGFMKGFSLNVLFILLVATAIPSFYYLLRHLGEKQSDVDEKEMLEFLPTIFDAKPKMS